LSGATSLPRAATWDRPERGGGNSLSEYQGIWLSSMAAVALATVLGAGIHVALRQRPAGGPSPCLR